MSWLRPSRTVVDPTGTRWEIYITRTRMGRWHGIDTPDVGLDVGGAGTPFVDTWLLFPLLVVLELLVGLVKLIALIPLSLAGVALRRGLRVEAIADLGEGRTYIWAVEKPALAGVLDEIAAGLAHGSIPRPQAARYLGERE